jgi:hypothetical protein
MLTFPHLVMLMFCLSVTFIISELGLKTLQTVSIDYAEQLSGNGWCYNVQSDYL